MRQSFLFTTLFVFVTLVVYAQTTNFKNIEESAKSRFVSHLKGYTLDEIRNSQGHLFHKGKISVLYLTLKSAQVIRQKLDSYSIMAWDTATSKWLPYSKHEFSYDSKGNLTLEKGYGWDKTTNLWDNDTKLEYTYDASNNLTQELFLFHDYSTNQLMAHSKNLYKYDERGNRTEYVHFMRDNITNQWASDYKLEYSFDASGNMIQEIMYNLDYSTNELAVNSKFDYSYDTSGNLTQFISYFLDYTTKQLVAQLKWEYSYNINGKETQNLQSYWDISSGQWIQSGRNNSTYDSKDNLVLSLQSGSDGISVWFDTNKIEYTYDTNGHVIEELQFWKTVNSEWKPQGKNEYIYDESGNKTEEISSDGWDETSNQWEYVNKAESTFDNNYASGDFIFPFDAVGLDFMTHMITDYKGYRWNVETKEWTSALRLTFNYSEQNVTSVNPLNSELSCVYPNPCSESVSISFPASNSQISFELFDLQGRMVMSKEISNNEKISLESLSKGIFLYNLYFGGKKQSGKLIKD